MKRPATLIPPAVLAVGLLFPAPSAEAHHAEFMSNAPFLQGLSMPVHGLDHLLSALAVGIVASRFKARSVSALLIAAYALVALAGGLLNVSGATLPDFVVPLTVAATGALLWMEWQGGWIPTCVAIVAAGFCHGDALMNQPAGGGQWSLFAAGCLGASLAVCLAGLCAGRLFTEARLRLAGAALMACTALVVLFPEANGLLIQLLEGSR
jgi:urease accessory protein